MAYPNGLRYFGARYWNARYFSYQGADVVPVADSPQTVIINITITPAVIPPQPGIGSGRVFLHPHRRPGLFFIGRLPPPN